MADVSGLGTASSGSMNSNAGAGGLDSVVSAVDAALTSLDPQQGRTAVGLVLRTLQGAPGVHGVTGTLEQLERQLAAGAPDRAQVGRLLTTLSTQTRELAGQAGPMAGVLHQLAGRLDAAGDKLAGGAA